MRNEFEALKGLYKKKGGKRAMALSVTREIHASVAKQMGSKDIAEKWGVDLRFVVDCINAAIGLDYIRADGMDRECNSVWRVDVDGYAAMDEG